MKKTGRPSKLTDQRWDELLRRLSAGEKAADLAREFGVSPTSISKRVSQPAKNVQTLASRLAKTEQAIESLPVSQQVAIRTLADRMKDLGDSLLETAATNARTAKVMAARAEGAALALTATPTLDDLKVPAAFIEVSNKATSLGVSLMNNRRESSEGLTLEDLVCGGGDGRTEKSLGEAIRKARLRVANGLDPFQTINVITGVPARDRTEDGDLKFNPTNTPLADPTALENP